ncbi:MAG: asparagine synthase (glutamine-hydrolyzing) [Phycisphaerales bacterium JB039]
MCGIAGIVRVHAPGSAIAPPEAAIPEPWLDVLDACVRHRGPDGQGRFRQRALRADGATVDVALVHRRLSVIDHAGGAQPMVLGSPPLRGGFSDARHPLMFGPRLPDAPPPAGPSDYAPARAHDCPACACRADGAAVAVVFNGCIYNHRELRRELEAEGHVFASDHADTEVWLHGWRAWGPALFRRLDGMFAAAIWDSASGALTLVRDGFGEKPLYTLGDVPEGALFAFSSAASGLIRLRSLMGGGPELLTESLRGWIKFGWSQDQIFPDVGSLIVGDWRQFPQREVSDDDARHVGERDWAAAAFARGNLSPTIDDVDGALRKAVHSRLDADVGVGCFLSGGVDSSLIAKYISEVRSDVTAFTVRMPQAAIDESETARQIAGRLGVRHEVLDCAPRPAEDMVAVIEQLGLPFGDSSLLPTMWVSRAARSAVSVALAGDGGDELFLGYDRHRAILVLNALSRLPRPVRKGLATLAPAGAVRRSRVTQLSRLLNAAAHDGYRELVAIFEPPHDRRLFLRPPGSEERSLVHHGGMTRHDTDGMLALRFDRIFYLPEDLLRKTDTASMSVALEVRAPLLAPPVAGLAFDAAVDALMPRGQRKGLLRAVARKYLPAAIVDRPKQGFAIPIGEWFRTDYGAMRQLLCDHLEGPEPFGPDALGVSAMIDMGYVRRMLREHDHAGAASLWPWKGRDHSQRLYMLLALSIWAKWLGRLPATIA